MNKQILRIDKSENVSESPSPPEEQNLPEDGPDDVLLSKVRSRGGGKRLPTPPFVMVPKNLVCSGRYVSSQEFRLWVTIVSHSRKNQNGSYQGCWPGRERLAKLMGISESRISNIVRRLKEKLLLRVIPRGQGKTAVYYPMAPTKSWRKKTETQIAKAKLDRRAERENFWRAGEKVTR